MALTNMKVDKNETYKESTVKLAEDVPKYPYCLQIRLEKEQLEKLGIEDLPEVGSDAYINAKCQVMIVSQSEGIEGYDSKCVCLQITDMSVSLKEDTLYGDED